MQVEIWSDVICPWCGIGQHRLEMALATFEHRDGVQVHHRSFQLDPSYAGEPIPVRDMLATKYGMPAAQLDATFDRVESLAQADGLTPYHVRDNMVGSTAKAHELLALAAEQGLEHAAWRRLYKAYFAERRSIFHVQELVALGEELGLQGELVREVLENGRYHDRVEADAREAQALGARGVPFVVVDRRFGIAGAQPTEVVVRTLEKAWRAAHGA